MSFLVNSGFAAQEIIKPLFNGSNKEVNLLSTSNDKILTCAFSAMLFSLSQRNERISTSFFML